MSYPVKASIWIYSNGTNLSDTDQQNGRDAAERVFIEHDADPSECFEALKDLDAANEQSMHQVGTRTRHLAGVWQQAEYAAIEAACKGWHRIPDDLSLGMA